MIIKFNSNKIRYTGRWNIGKNSATSTANGNYFEFMYSGECAVIGFDMSNKKNPFPHVYISVDDSACVEATLDRYIRLSGPEGIHKVCVIMKGSVENQSRWLSPLEAAVSLLDIEADAFLDMPEDTRPVIEFIGDSITEGISIDTGYSNYGDERDMVYWDDSTAGYAWRTARLLDFRPVIMGYGCLGLSKGGAGGVPPVSESYKYYSQGCPMESWQSDFVVINHGTNDAKADKEFFEKKYCEFLNIVRERNPISKIISMTPFSGCLAREIESAVQKHNTQKNDDVLYINTTGWIDASPVHPTRDSHKFVSERLSEIIKEQF